MNIAIIYESVTGNTKLLAETIKEVLGENVVYCGTPKYVEADCFIVGSWTDKGQCSEGIRAFLETLDHKTIIYFGTAGFGGSEAYFKALEERVKTHIHSTNKYLGAFYCQGRMPETVKKRYISLLHDHPEDKKLQVSLKNYEEALSHPDQRDLDNLKEWIKGLIY